MTRRMTLAVSLAALVPATIAAADALEVTEARRALTVWASGYDWEFNDIDGFAVESLATSGAYVEAFDVELFDWYGQHVAQGIGSIDSDITCDTIRFTLSAEGITDQAQVTEADGGAEVNAEFSFDLAEPKRVVVSGASNGGGEYAWGYAIFREVGVQGPPLADVGFEQGFSNTTSLHEVLDAGSYRIDAFLQAWAFGGYNITSECGGFVDFTLTAYHLADVNLSGTVTVDDLVDVVLAFGTDDDDADITRDGTVSIDDLVAVVTSWGAGCD